MHGASLHRPAAVRRIESACIGLACAALLALVVLVTAEVVARSFFNFSFELVDEVGGYLLAALSFFALAPSLAGGAFHSVEFIQHKLAAGARQRLVFAFTLLSLAFTGVMLGVVVRYVWRSWVQQDVASTLLQTPLWIPQLVMIVGLAALAVTLTAQGIGQWRSWPRDAGERP